MNKELKDNKEWIELKATLHFVEEKILGIMDVNGWMWHKELKEQVKDLLSDRHVIMNKMFRMYVTEKEVARFREVNDHLLVLTQRLYDGHDVLMDFLCVNFIESCYPGTIIQVESRLDVDEAAEVLHFDDDGDYGSSFAQMLDALAWTENMEIRSFITNLGEKPVPDNLDDGTMGRRLFGHTAVQRHRGLLRHPRPLHPQELFRARSAPDSVVQYQTLP